MTPGIGDAITGERENRLTTAFSSWTSFVGAGPSCHTLPSQPLSPHLVTVNRLGRCCCTRCLIGTGSCGQVIGLKLDAAFNRKMRAQRTRVYELQTRLLDGGSSGLGSNAGPGTCWEYEEQTVMTTTRTLEGGVTHSRECLKVGDGLRNPVIQIVSGQVKLSVR
jgi:hypothetical protein